MKNLLEENASIINAENTVLGRLASIVAKRLLNGERIIITNADKILISGNHRANVQKYQQRRKIRTKSNPLRGPFYPRQSDQIVRRTIRGMLPHQKGRGKDAYNRLLVFKDVPAALSENTFEEIPEVKNFNPKSPYLTLRELSSKI
ncbi:MAG: 50S ribosomal protein L13 [Candidatus Thorarchaeota archaeon]